MKSAIRFVSAALLVWLAFGNVALAQSTCPAFANGMVLTAGQWQACFDAKQNSLGFTPVNRAGDVMQGPLGTVASAAAKAGFNLPQGADPTSPINGDLWTKSTGIYVRINGVTVGPLSGSTSGSFAATSPITVSFPSSVVTYAFDFTVANTFKALQSFSLNAGTLPTAISNTVIRAGGVDGSISRVVAEGYANGGTAYGAVTVARADGTAAAPTGVQSGEQIGAFNAFAYGSNSAWNGPIASLRSYAAENISGTAWGSKVCIATTPITTITITDSLCQQNSGGVTIGSPTGGDKGAGTINVSGLAYSNGNALAASATAPLVLNATTGALTCPTCATSTLNGAALTKTDDTNVTLTLGGTPATALLNAASITVGWTGQAAVSRGGTGLGTLTAHAVLLGEGTSNVAFATIGTSGRLLIDQGAGADPSFNAMSGDATIINTGAITLATVNSNVGSFGGSTAIPVITANGKGLITALSTAVVIAPAGTLTGTTLNSTVVTSSLTSVGTLAAGTTITSLKTASIFPPSDSTTALQIFKADGSTRVMDFDTTNARVGINKTPGAFDLDVNGAANIGGVLTFGTLSATSLGASTSTITGLTANNSPNAANDYQLYFSAADGAIRKCTIGSCSSAGASGITNIDGLTGAFTTSNGITSTGNALQLTAARRTLPTVQTFTSGSSATYTTPANALWLEVYACGGGGGGGGAANGISTAAGSSGTTTTFNSVNAAGGSGAGGSSAINNSPVGGAGGTGGTGTATRRMAGAPGGNGSVAASTVAIGSGAGGNSVLFGGGAPGFQVNATNVGNSGITNTGGGGSGATNNAANSMAAAGGGGGECFYNIINSPAGTYTYTVGTGGAGGVQTTNGGPGADGKIQVVEHYGT